MIQIKAAVRFRFEGDRAPLPAGPLGVPTVRSARCIFREAHVPAKNEIPIYSRLRA